ncbi:MATE family efflux transporter [Helicobacter didelphidarum]|uniref:Multidrug-efflux transporter n=1 Tax=Helicobacter didelphidarum TaxID=2040648 RepID=A0A3D8IP16_9HELI|nr:MATE family efflux transporter [Helicobacter didelphidarum]RDU66962.1 MATE family efflux transporter [Helicobacter didelphidarum]
MFVLRLHQRIKIKRILNIAIPSGLQSAFDMLSMGIALFFLGNISPLNFTALGVGANYIIVFYPLSAIFGIGTNVLMSRRYGATNYTEMNIVYSTMSYAASIFSLPVLFLAFACLSFYLHTFNLSEELYSLTYSYVSLTLFAIPAIMIKNVLISGFAATGDTKRPFYIKIVLTCFSILGYFIFIDGKFGFPALELRGAAYVTLIISYLELFILSLLPYFVKTQLKLIIQFQWKFLISALKVGIPTGIERTFSILALNVVLIFVGQYANMYGDSAMTGFQAGTKIEGFSFVPGFGFMVAVMSLVGQSIGAKNYKLADEYTKLSATIASILLGICGIILAVFAKPLSDIFIQQDFVAVQISIVYLLAVGLSQTPLILCFVYDGALRGAGYTQIPLLINIISISVFRLVPMWICSSFAMSLYILFLIIFLETYIRAVIFYWIFKSGIWKKPKEL